MNFITFACYFADFMEQSNNNTQKNRPQQPRPRRPRMRLPFDNRNDGLSVWIYDNRVGLCITTIAILAMAIAFVVSKIDISGKDAPDTIIIDFSELEQLEQKRDKLEEELRQAKQDIDWSKVKNDVSNENATNENIKDDKHTNTSELNQTAEDVQREMAANREAYERGLREVDAIGQEQPNKRGSGDSENKDKKVKGHVMVSFSFSDPTRYSRHLEIPAYRCEGGGEVIVSATLNQSGEVIAAEVESGGDACMRQVATQAARASKFDINSNAPSKQKGTISYIFIPQ